MMAKIVLINPGNNGHHISYGKAIIDSLQGKGHKVYVVGDIKWCESLEKYVDGSIHVTINPFKPKTIGGELEKLRFVKRTLDAAATLNADLIHFLYLDHYIAAFALCAISCKAALRFSLHWAYILPEVSFGSYAIWKNRIETALLKYILWRGARVIVHSELIRTRMMEIMQTKNLDFVPYPIEHFPSVDREFARAFIKKIIKIKENVVLLIAFGDTRDDKGVDLAIEALSKLPSNYELLIAGRPSSFSEEELRQRAHKNSVENRVHFVMEFIPDEAIPVYFTGADIVLIPYRRRFSGQSGPLTIAAQLGAKIVAADTLVLAETVRKYGLGTLFEPESSDALAAAIVKSYENKTLPKTELFVRDHRDIAMPYC